MERLPHLHASSSYATAITVEAGALHLEPVRVLDDRWCLRRNCRLIPVEPSDADAFIMPDGTVDDGIGLWPRTSAYLADRGVYVPGGGDVLAAAERAGHWQRIAVPVESWSSRRSDLGVSATLARGVAA